MSNSVKILYPTQIVLSETTTGVNPEVQIFRVGKFRHPEHGVLDISPMMLADLKNNFEKNVYGIDVSFDYFHESEKIAAGWLRRLELREGGSELWATEVEWTPRARKMLAEKELRYFSPDFGFQWQNPETQVVHKNILFGGGLTNRPFIKKMKAITLSEDDVNYMLSQDDTQKCVADLIPKLIAEGHDHDQAIAIAYSKCGQDRLTAMENETDYSQKGDLQMDAKDTMIQELKAEIAALKAKLDGAEGEKTGVMGEMKKLQEQVKGAEDRIKLAEDKAVKAEREQKFTVMLSEGKACVAQKEAYLSNDMEKFVSLAQPINLSEKGSNAGGGDETTGLDVEEKVLKLAEVKLKAGMTKTEATRAVLLENPELAKQYADL